MSFRDMMNKRPRLSGAIALVGVLAIGILIWFQAKSLAPPKPGAHYSNDDGASYFSDAPDRVTPSDRNGKPAVRPRVSQNDGKPFVGYLERQTPQAGALITRVKNRKPGDPSPTPAEMGIVMSGREFKKPGEPSWIPLGKGELVRKITSITAPRHAGDRGGVKGLQAVACVTNPPAALLSFAGSASHGNCPSRRVQGGFAVIDLRHQRRRVIKRRELNRHFPRTHLA